MNPTSVGRLRRLAARHETTLVVACVAGVVLLTVASGGGFLSGNSVRIFFQFLTVPVLIGLAQMVALCVGQLNLAVGALGGCAAALIASLLTDSGWPTLPALALALVITTAIGALTGLLVVLTQINGFIVTLATMTVLLGVQYGLVSTRTVAIDSPALSWFGSATVAQIPVPFLFAVAVAAALAWFFARTVWGRRLLAAGGNPVAAKLSGISTDRQIVVAHTLSAALVGLAALVSVATLPGINKSVGGDWLLPSFAAPIIGGVALTGGSVRVLGTVLAAVLVRLVDSARAQFELTPSWVNFVIGAVVLGTVVIARVRQSRETTRAENARVAASPSAQGALS